MTPARTRLELLDRDSYGGVDHDDPLRFYFVPVFGPLYRRRVELCLDACRGGESVLEIGFGSGLTFLNLSRLYRNLHGLDLTCDTAEVARRFAGHGLETDLRNGSVLDLPYGDESFDTVLLISILEHLRPEEQPQAFREIRRVLKPGGQVVYGVPVERPFMVLMFRLLGYDIRQHHFSTHDDVHRAAGDLLEPADIRPMRALPGLGAIYEVGCFVKPV